MQNLKNIIIFAIIALIIAGIGLFFFSPKRTATPTTPSTTPILTSTPQSGQPVQGQGTTNAPITQTNDQTITLTTTGFTPATITVKTGTKITWVNKSGSLGDVDSDPYKTKTSYPAMNFGTFTDGSTFSLVFTKAGSYHYHNELNSSQTGTIFVQ